MLRTALWALGGVWLLFVGQARAAGGNDEAARLHFQAGRDSFERADYDDAVGQFEQAYQLSGRPPMLINISKAHEAAGRPTEAADALTRWQAVAAAAHPMRHEIKGRLKRLRVQAAKMAAAVEPAAAAIAPEIAAPTAAEPEEHSPERHSKVVPWCMAGVGGAMLAGGVVLTLIGRSDISAVESPAASARWNDVEKQADRGPTRLGAGLALAGVGAVALGVGLSWLLIGRQSSTSDQQARLEVTPFGARLRGQF